MDLEFLVGGLPRSGTTAVANLFNFHPAAHCCAQESAIAPMCLHFAGSAPVAQRHLPSVRQEVFRWLDLALRDIGDHHFDANAAFEAERQWNRFDAQRVRFFAHRISDLLEAGLYGEELIRRSLAAFRNEIATDTQRAFIGEKSPDNVFALARFGQLGAKLAVVMKREPCGFVRSMRLVQTGAERFDKLFRQSFWKMLGMYINYAEAIARLRPAAGLLVVDYEDLLAYPLSFTSKFFATAGFTPNAVAEMRAAASLRPQKSRRAWADLPAAELAIVWHVTQDARAQLGYNAGYYARQGLLEQPSSEAFCVAADGAHAMTGFHSNGADNPLLWLADVGRLAVETMPQTTKVTFSFWVNLPPSVLPLGGVATLDICAGSPEHVVARLAVTGGPCDCEVTIDLHEVAPLLASSAGALRIFTFRASHAFCPVALPASDAAAGFDSPDPLMKFGLMRPPVFE